MVLIYIILESSFYDGKMDSLSSNTYLMSAVFSMIQLPGREEKEEEKKKEALKAMYEYWKQNNICASALLKQNPPICSKRFVVKLPERSSSFSETLNSRDKPVSFMRII